ncbi:MAG: T9SS type A sorting domain-containing protein [Candidatus Kapabacteria bacterium]|nr:T9SS type A sorting domain-containing protein [Candidatus Kapabacteria bacterium]
MKKVILFVFFLSISSIYSQWIPINNGINSTTLNYEFATDGKTLVSSNLNGISISSDNGASWENIGLSGKVINVLSIYNNNILAGEFNVLGTNTIYYSSNLGDSWDTLKAKNQMYTSFLCKGDYIFVSTDSNGILLSTDNGKTWQERNNGIDPKRISALCMVTDGEKICMSTGDIIYLSTNNGEKWEEISGISSKFPQLAIKGDRIIAGLPWSGLYLTTDGGKNWNNLEVPTNRFITAVGISTNYIYCSFERYGNNEDYVFYMSSDNGESWQVVDEIKSNIVYSINVYNDSVYACTPSGVYFSSDNCETWQIIGTPMWYVSTIGVNKGYIFTSTNTGIYKSSDYGDNWEKMNFDYTDVSSFAFDGNDIYLGRGDVYKHTGGVYKSTDNGTSWEITGLKDVFIPAVGVKDGKIFAGTGIYGKNGDFRRDSGDIFVSFDKGASWELSLEDQYIHKFDANDSMIFAVADYGGGILFSSDGRNWINRYGLLISPGQAQSFISLSVDGERVVAGTLISTENDGILYSTNNGYDWEKIGIVPSDYLTYQVQSLLIDGNNIFAGLFFQYYEGIHLTTNKGINWVKKNDGLTCLSISSLAKKDGYIFAGTKGGGMFRAKISDFITDVKENPMQSQSPLSPNPARDYIIATQYIGWDYQIYDLLGNCVQSGLIDADKINISSLPAGFYTVRFYKDGKQFVEKMMKEM